MNKQQTIFFPIPQGQNWVQVTGASLPFLPVEASATTASGANGPVIGAACDRSTLTQDGALFNLTGSTLDGNQVLIATFYAQPQPCPVPLPQPFQTPDYPDFFICVRKLHCELSKELWPYGEAENLVVAHRKFIGEALTMLMMFAKPLQENNVGLWPFCSTFFDCGMTVIDAPFNGIIRKVSTYDAINETTGMEDATQYTNWCSEVRYVNVEYRMMRKFVDKNLAYLGFPTGTCGCGVLLPAFSPLINIFQQFSWCGKTPGSPYTTPNQTGQPTLPQGVLFPNANADGVRRARIGMWSLHRGRIYIAPWIQSTETVLVEWDGVRMKWRDHDLTEDNNILKKAVGYYVLWQHFAKGFDDNPQMMQTYQENWMDAQAELLHWYRRITRRRMIEESFARAAQQSILSEGLTSSSTSTTTTQSTSSSTTTTLSTSSTSSSSTSTVSTSSSSTSTVSTSTVSTSSTSSSSSTTSTSTTTAGQVFIAAVTIGAAQQFYSFGTFPPGHYRVYYEAGMVGVYAGTDSNGTYYNCGLNFANGNVYVPGQPSTFEGFYIYVQTGGLNQTAYAGPNQTDFTQYGNAHAGNVGELNTALGNVQSHFSGSYADFTTTYAGGIQMEYHWGINNIPGTNWYPYGVTFYLYQVFP